MLLKVDDVRMVVGFSPFVFCQSIPDSFERSPRRGIIGLSRVTRGLPISVELQDKGFVFGQCDRQVIEFKHSFRPTVLVERPAIISGLARSFKRSVLFLFSPENTALKPSLFKLKFNLFSAHSAALTNSVKKNRLKINVLESISPVKPLNSTLNTRADRAGVF